MESSMSSSLIEGGSPMARSRKSRSYQSLDSQMLSDIKIEGSESLLMDLELMIRTQTSRILNVIAEKSTKAEGTTVENVDKLREEYAEKYQGLYDFIDDIKMKTPKTDIDSLHKELERRELWFDEIQNDNKDLVAKREKLNREVSNLKNDYQLLETKYKRMEKDNLDLTDQISDLRKEKNEIMADLDLTKRQMELIAKENQVHRACSAKTGDINKFVAVQNILEVSVKLKEDMVKQLNQIRCEAQTKHREVLTVCEKKIKEDYEQQRQKYMKEITQEMNAQKDESQKKLKELMEEHEEEIQVLKKRIAKQMIAKETDEPDGMKRFMDISMVDEREDHRARDYSVKFVFAPILSAAKLFEEAQKLDASVKVLEHQEHVKNHEIHSSRFRLIWNKAIEFLSVETKSTLSKWMEMTEVRDSEEIQRNSKLSSIASITTQIEIDNGEEEEGEEKTEEDDEDENGMDIEEEVVEEINELKSY